MKGYALAYTDSAEHRIHIAQNLLEQEGISCWIISKKDSSYLFGSIELHVPETELAKAKELLKSLNHE